MGGGGGQAEGGVIVRGICILCYDWKAFLGTWCPIRCEAIWRFVGVPAAPCSASGCVTSAGTRPSIGAARPQPAHLFSRRVQAILVLNRHRVYARVAHDADWVRGTAT